MSRRDGLLRDRAGDLFEMAPEPLHRCRGGWMGPESEPSPCPTCKPMTVERLRAERARFDARERTGDIR